MSKTHRSIFRFVCQAIFISGLSLFVRGPELSSEWLQYVLRLASMFLILFSWEMRLQLLRHENY